MIYTLTVECVRGMHLKEECIRVIEIPDDATLCDVHEVIQDAVGFDRDHLFCFYMGRNSFNRKVMLGAMDDWEEGEEDPLEIPLRDIFPLEKRMKLYYWFDFGDDWIFEVKKKRKETEADPEVTYPRVIERIGPNPEQYPELDEEEYDDEECDDEE